MTAGANLEIVSPGAYASIQDAGRRGFRRIGVPWAGVIDPRLMRIANALVGNAADAPVIECFDGGLQLAARGATLRVAVAGDARLELEHAGERSAVPAWRSVSLADGDILRIRRMDGGRIAMVAVQGMALSQVMGSASTYARAALGGVDGGALRAGMHLPAPPARAGAELALPRPPDASQAPVRVVPGPQADHFAQAALDTFFGSDYRVTAEADRMGVRLEGPALEHLGTREIISDATVPGSIQVPGNGQPIVLLADAQTAGGYPKIATVICSDIPRLAACRPGQTIRFAAVGAADGERIARATEAETRALIAGIVRVPAAGIDEAALYSANLVSGVVHALSPDYRTLGAANE
ncbi:biotin-dependent carboxyltransferase family protein [Azoarcus sp. L1K30]|uniref:5-oxoprolinase subunit C family protein n=1 Tax=Azoarcus sp. L1K30 TaxID=2820277 RepID=UPI001B84629A|nr:biotin-dependent carboxyltransferase family protein [Azoarcus sp. L1K30]